MKMIKMMRICWIKMQIAKIVMNESGREKKSNADKGKKQRLNRKGEEAREKSCME